MGVSPSHRRLCSSERVRYRGQRERKAHPGLSSVGLGRSPLSTTRLRFLSTSGSGIGTADSSACV